MTKVVEKRCRLRGHGDGEGHGVCLDPQGEVEERAARLLALGQAHDLLQLREIIAQDQGQLGRRETLAGDGRCRQDGLPLLELADCRRLAETAGDGNPHTLSVGPVAGPRTVCGAAALGEGDTLTT